MNASGRQLSWCKRMDFLEYFACPFQQTFQSNHEGKSHTSRCKDSYRRWTIPAVLGIDQPMKQLLPFWAQSRWHGDLDIPLGLSLLPWSTHQEPPAGPWPSDTLPSDESHPGRQFFVPPAEDIGHFARLLQLMDRKDAQRHALRELYGRFLLKTWQPI